MQAVSGPGWGDGGCACGAVRFSVQGAPLRAGLCHCMKCRRAHASAFNFFVVYRPEQVEIRGDEMPAWESSPGVYRHFCARCGSRIAELDGKEVELYAGGFDDAGRFIPQYESWVVHREPWLVPLAVPQNREDSGAG